jgi:hypothetical protein
VSVCGTDPVSIILEVFLGRLFEQISVPVRTDFPNHDCDVQRIYLSHQSSGKERKSNNALVLVSSVPPSVDTEVTEY